MFKSCELNLLRKAMTLTCCNFAGLAPALTAFSPSSSNCWVDKVDRYETLVDVAAGLFLK